MPIANSARVHPSAVVSDDATLGENVEVGPFVVVEGPVAVGDDCVVRAGAHLIGPLVMGRGNVVSDHAVLGGRPQHKQYQGEPTRVQIGDFNVFREHVTVHRGTTQSWETRIGSHNFLMANAHVAHDCRIGDHCLLANGSLVGGHCTLENNVFLSGNSALHQFVRVGRLALLSGVSGSTLDLPPFIIVQRINAVVGVNVIGMRRAGIPTTNIDAVRRAFHIIYREERSLPAALTQVDAELGSVSEVAELASFIRASTRGVSLHFGRQAA